MSTAEVSDFLEKILNKIRAFEDRQRLTTSSWNDSKVSGNTLQTAASTTFPPNSRFAFIEDQDFLNPDEVDNRVTHNNPLYTVTVNIDGQWIIRNQQRDFYVPGFDSNVGVSAQFESVPEGNFVPDHVTWEGGYGQFHNQQLNGISNVQSNPTLEGAVMHVIPDDADLRIYKNDSVASSLPLSEWEFNPFTHPDFNFNLSNFFVLQEIYDLYGGGDFTFFLKLRDINGIENFKELGSVGIEDEPALNVYNLGSGSKVQLGPAASSSIDYSIGPIEYHNNFDGTLPDRIKGEPFFNTSISTTVSSNSETVIATYRLQPENIEAPSQVTRLTASMASTGGSSEEAIVQARQVHRDFLTFPNDTDPDDDSNWIAPGGPVTQQVRETSIEKLDVNPGDVSISTYTDSDNQTKIRGEQEEFVALTTSNDDRTAERDIDAEAFMNEFKYLVLLGSISDTSIDFRKIRLDIGQIW